MTALVIDTETTDVENAEVIEYAWTEWEIGITAPRISVARFKPKGEISFGAMAVHHILPFELEGLPPFNGQWASDVDYLIGHNIDFDWKAVGSPDIRRIDTLPMARKLWPELDSHKLGALMYFIHGATSQTRDKLQSAHSAAADVGFCIDLLSVIIEKTGINTLRELWLYSEQARIPDIMPFGKYKGQPISAIPSQYISWAMKQPDFDPYVLEAFKRKTRS
jgi:exodeoxyribonuclease X